MFLQLGCSILGSQAVLRVAVEQLGCQLRSIFLTAEMPETHPFDKLLAIVPNDMLREPDLAVACLLDNCNM